MADTVAQKIVIWARGQMGKKIGRGECWDLAEQALINAKGKTSNDLGEVGDDIDYIWGDAYLDAKDAIPGDILQIRNHTTTWKIVEKYKFPDGNGNTETSEEELERPHHTSIVTSTLDSDGALTTIEQNVDPGGRVVQNKKLYTRDVAPSIVKKRMAKENPGTGKKEVVDVTITTTITITGTIWYYHPIAK